MADRHLVDHAKKLLLSDPLYLEDARQGIAVGNTLVGSVMTLITKAPRQYTEAAVREALAEIDAGDRLVEEEPPSAIPISKKD